MKRTTIFVIVILATMLAPMTALAQEPGSGGPIIEGNGGTSIGPINDLRCSGTDCRAITQWLAVGFLGVDPVTQYFAPDIEGAMVKDWTVSEDGLTYTFNLVDNLVWSDGEPVDGWDYLFTYYAYKHADEFESPYGYTVDDIESVEVSEDGYTVTVKFLSAACGVLSDAAKNVVPSHVFGWTPEMGEDYDWASLIGHPYETAPDVSGGPFVFNSMDPERVVLLTNTHYYKTVVPEGFLYVTVPDQTVMAERFIAGELNVIDTPQAAKREEIRNNANLQVYDYAAGLWDYLSLNFANPDNPMDGFEKDADGNPVLDENGLPIPVPQDPHPLFGDVRVRRAIQLAIDLDEIMEKAVLGEGTVMPSFLVPSSWAFDPNLKPITRDLDAARALLAEAGWADTDGDGILDKDGVKFSFEILTNEGNTRRGQIAELTQQHLAEVGMEVQVSAIDFNQLLDLQDAQTFDAVVLGWRNSYPDDPDWTGLFTTDGDIVGSGFNSMSYSNPEVDRLMKAANNVPGCKPEDRAPLYWELQKILQDDQAYIWLFAQNGFYAANKSITNWSPMPNNLFWRAEDWVITK
ncbi:MAG: hypothetical protein HRF48_19125 [Chloroflexota bacterium]|jgi:peptide/nickel transport system substrate-binding protein